MNWRLRVRLGCLDCGGGCGDGGCVIVSLEVVRECAEHLLVVTDVTIRIPIMH